MIDKLRRGICLVNACYMCKQDEESCNHLLLWCLVVHKLWTMVYNFLGINWVVAGLVKDELCA